MEKNLFIKIVYTVITKLLKLFAIKIMTPIISSVIERNNKYLLLQIKLMITNGVTPQVDVTTKRLNNVNSSTVDLAILSRYNTLTDGEDGLDLIDFSDLNLTLNTHRQVSNVNLRKLLISDHVDTILSRSITEDINALPDFLRNSMNKTL